MIETAMTSRLNVTAPRARVLPAARRRPGLHVTLATRVGPQAPIVRVEVGGGAGAIRVYLYVDGALVEAWIPAERASEFAAVDLVRGCHTVTARAIDGLGRWGAASILSRAS